MWILTSAFLFKFPSLKTNFFAGAKWIVFATAQSTICWMVIHHLNKESSKAAEEQRFRESENSQWGPHAAQAMVESTRHFPLSIGTKKMTMGDLYDVTKPELISKVMLEEKIFQTWYSGRTVLLGDGNILIDILKKWMVLLLDVCCVLTSGFFLCFFLLLCNHSLP